MKKRTSVALLRAEEKEGELFVRLEERGRTQKELLVR